MIKTTGNSKPFAACIVIKIILPLDVSSLSNASISAISAKSVKKAIKLLSSVRSSNAFVTDKNSSIFSRRLSASIVFSFCSIAR
ncbi:hypothetical protein D3C79_973470 [compost metagenome]